MVMDKAEKIIRGKLEIVFLFILSDGKVTRDKYKTFDTIGSNFSGFKELRRKIIDGCLNMFTGSIARYNPEKRFAAIKQYILSIADDKLYSYGDKPARFQMECIWILILLAFNEGDLSENKKDILKSLCEKWRIKTAVVAEMIDTAETLVVTDEQIVWMNEPKESEGKFSLFKKKNYSNLHINEVSSELKKNQKELNDSIEYLINDEAEPEHDDDEEDEDEDEEDEEYEDFDEDEDDEGEEDDEEDNKKGESKEAKIKTKIEDWIEDEHPEDAEEEDDEDDSNIGDVWSKTFSRKK
jgi:hypothetical protein